MSYNERLAYEINVTHLKLGHAFWHKFRPICFDPAPRFDPPPSSRPFGGTLQRGVSRASFRLSAAAHLHGFCPTDLEGRAARYCRVFERTASHSIPFGIPGADCQIWIAVCVYLMVAIVHKELDLPGTMHRTLQLLSIHPFEKTPLHQLLTDPDSRDLDPLVSNQLMLR